MKLWLKSIIALGLAEPEFSVAAAGGTAVSVAVESDATV